MAFPSAPSISKNMNELQRDRCDSNTRNATNKIGWNNVQVEAEQIAHSDAHDCATG